MQFFVKSGHPEKQRAGCVVVGIFERRKFSGPAEQLNTASNGTLASIMRRGDMDGKLGQTLILYKPGGLFADRVLLVGCGRERDFNDGAFRKACTAAAEILSKIGGKDAISYLTELNVKGRDPVWKTKQAVLAVEAEFYRFDECKGESARKNNEPPSVERITFNVPSRVDLPEGEEAIREAHAIGAGIALAKRLGNLPANVCTPAFLADEAKALSKRLPAVKTKVLEQSDMEALGMGALLAVARGSRQPPKLVIMEYQGGSEAAKPQVLVGKGITFDAGGISLKPGAKMDEMKFDMCGGASVFGAMQMAAEMKLPLNLVGLVACSENLPDGQAVKPGDIVTTLSGQTVEILNTDAEGRLVLCDTLTYVEQNYEPAAVVDMATLTGACVVALGSHASALYGNRNALVRALRGAGEDIGDRVWEMPLWEEYQEQLKSPFADFANIGGPKAGSVTAACFLHRFTRNMRWAHMDIAGTAWRSDANKGATGRPVPLLCQYLLDQAERDKTA
jgi:leucyl aminopeptidase